MCLETIILFWSLPYVLNDYNRARSWITWKLWSPKSWSCPYASISMSISDSKVSVILSSKSFISSSLPPTSSWGIQYFMKKLLNVKLRSFVLHIGISYWITEFRAEYRNFVLNYGISFWITEFRVDRRNYGFLQKKIKQLNFVLQNTNFAKLI